MDIMLRVRSRLAQRGIENRGLPQMSKSVPDGSFRSPAHGEAALWEAIAMAQSGRYKTVYMNRGYNLALGDKAVLKRMASNLKPDVLGARLDGKFDVVEAMSATDDQNLLRWWNQQIRKQLPPRRHQGDRKMMSKQVMMISIAFFWKGKIDRRVWNDGAPEILRLLGSEPDFVKTTGEKREGKFARFDKGIVQASDGERNYFVSTNRSGSFDGEWSAAAVKYPDCCVFAFGGNRVGIRDMRRVAEVCEAWIPYYYGFGYELHKDRRPELYAVGVNAGLGYDDAAMEEAARVTAWFDNYKLAARGLIRDVYPLNVLSEQHIAKKVGEVSLGSWIMAAGYRGRLEELSQGHHVWTVEAKDIAKVRAELAQSGLLVALARETDV